MILKAGLINTVDLEPVHVYTNLTIYLLLQEATMIHSIALLVSTHTNSQIIKCESSTSPNFCFRDNHNKIRRTTNTGIANYVCTFIMQA